jgi:hypothetical protein
VNPFGLLARSREAGLTVSSREGQIHVARPKPSTSEVDALVAELKAHRDAVEAALLPCCGQRWPGVEGDPQVPGCQLCTSSPTYWRNT